MNLLRIPTEKRSRSGVEVATRGEDHFSPKHAEREVVNAEGDESSAAGNVALAESEHLIGLSHISLGFLRANEHHQPQGESEVSPLPVEFGRSSSPSIVDGGSSQFIYSFAD